MDSIVSDGHPFKIFRSVVELVAIYMIHHWEVVRVWDKGFGYKTMDRMMFLLFAIINLPSDSLCWSSIALSRLVLQND